MKGTFLLTKNQKLWIHKSSETHSGKYTTIFYIYKGFSKKNKKNLCADVWVYLLNQNPH